MNNPSPRRGQLLAFLCFLGGAEPLRALLVPTATGTADPRPAQMLIAQAAVGLGLAAWLLWRSRRAPEQPG